jgi:mxaC protein
VTLALDHPAALVLLVGCVPALLGWGSRWFGVASAGTFPVDVVSRVFDLGLRALAALPVAAIVLALAGLHQGQQAIWRSFTGAHVMVVLDRSLSMDEPFSLLGEKASETKTQAASRMLADLFARRPHDRFGLVAFSTSPILAMPLTSHREAVSAAIAAMDAPGLANTEIGGGLALGLAQFADDAPGATHVLLLVTDGAGVIPDQTRAYIKAQARLQDAHLYYLYLRAGDDPPLAEDLGDSVNLGRPAGLDAYFRTLGISYAGFEARDPDAVARAAHKIDELETQKIAVRDLVKQRELDRACLVFAALCLALSLLAQLAERSLPAWDMERAK